MKSYQPLKGNVLAEYKDEASGATAYIMDTFIRNVPPEEMKRRIEKATVTAQRIWDRYLQEHPNCPD